MTNYFVDTSALARRYLINEKGSGWVRSWLPASTGNVIIIAELTVVELSSVLARKVENGSLSKADAASLKSDFFRHARKEFLVFPLDEGLLQRASSLVDVHRGLRSLDAIQMAGALEAKTSLQESLTFISADKLLLGVAVKEGFPTDNPELHP